MGYPLKMVIEIVDLPIDNGDFPCIYIYTGWWYTYPSEEYEKVSWDDEIPNRWKVIKNVPNHQPAKIAMEKWGKMMIIAIRCRGHLASIQTIQSHYTGCNLSSSSQSQSDGFDQSKFLIVSIVSMVLTMKIVALNHKNSFKPEKQGVEFGFWV